MINPPDPIFDNHGTIILKEPAIDVALFLTLASITIFPIFYFNVLPLADLPTHMARLAVIQSNGADPVLSKYYVLNWNLVTNLAVDIWAYITSPFFDLEMTIRSFIALSMLLLTSGTIFVHRALGGTGPWPFISFVFVWNEILVWGFLSFLFSIGVALWLFGYWVAFRGRNIIFRVALHAIAAIVLLIFHLFGFAVYALAVGSYEAGNVVLKWRTDGVQMPGREFFGGALQFIPALALFFYSKTSSGTFKIEFLNLYEKIVSYSSSILLYSPLAQIIVVALFISIMVYALQKRWAHISAPCWFIVLTGTLCSVFAPHSTFGSHFLSHRMPVALTFLFLALIQVVDFGRTGNRLFRVILVTVVTAHTVFIAWQWTGYQLIYEDFFKVTQSVNEDDKVLSMTLATGRRSADLRPPLERAVHYLIPKRKIFNPHVFADSRHQPMELTTEALVLNKLAPHLTTQPFGRGPNRLIGELENTEFHLFDYVLTVRMDAYEDYFPKDWVLRDQAGLFRLYEPGVKEASHTK